MFILYHKIPKKQTFVYRLYVKLETFQLFLDDACHIYYNVIYLFCKQYFLQIKEVKSEKDSINYTGFNYIGGPNFYIGWLRRFRNCV